MPVEIRPASKQDYDQLCELFTELDEFHRLARPELFKKSEGPARSKDHLAKLMADDAGIILVAENVARLDGLSMMLMRSAPATPLHVPRRVGEIDNLVVRACARRQGVGRALVAASIDWAKGHGATDIEVAVHAFNREAIEFYEALGFTMSVHRLLLRGD